MPLTVNSTRPPNDVQRNAPAGGAPTPNPAFSNAIQKARTSARTQQEPATSTSARRAAKSAQRQPSAQQPIEGLRKRLTDLTGEIGKNAIHNEAGKEQLIMRQARNNSSPNWNSWAKMAPICKK